MSPLAAIAAAGSLGRLEAGPNSDLDAIVILAEHAAPDAVAHALDRVWASATQAGFKVPKANGIFRHGIARAQLLAPEAIGRIDESPAVFGKRIQILLDARAFHGDAYFASLRRATLEWYLAPSRQYGVDDPWEYLLSDLLRYANAYKNWQVAKLTRAHDDSWALRQAKLRSSRFVTWLGMWMLILCAREMPGHGVDWVQEQLTLTPLERVELVIRAEAPQVMHDLLVHYDAIQSLMQNAAVRARLVASALPAVDVDHEAAHDEYAVIMSHGRQMRAAVAAFIANRFATRSAPGSAMSVPF